MKNNAHIIALIMTLATSVSLMASEGFEKEFTSSRDSLLHARFSSVGSITDLASFKEFYDENSALIKEDSEVYQKQINQLVNHFRANGTHSTRQYYRQEYDNLKKKLNALEHKKAILKLTFTNLFTESKR